MTYFSGYERDEVPRHIDYEDMCFPIKPNDLPLDDWNYTLFDGSYYKHNLQYPFPAQVDMDRIHEAVVELGPAHFPKDFYYVKKYALYYPCLQHKALDKSIDLRLLNLDNYSYSKRVFRSSEEFLDWADFQNDKNENNPVECKCNLCDFICKNEYQLANHKYTRNCQRRQKQKEAREKKINYIPESEKVVYCQDCDCTLRNKYVFAKHCKESKKHKENCKEVRKELPKTCEVCEKEYDTKTKFKRHLKQSKKCHKIAKSDIKKFEKWIEYHHLFDCKFKAIETKKVLIV